MFVLRIWLSQGHYLGLKEVVNVKWRIASGTLVLSGIWGYWSDYRRVDPDEPVEMTALSLSTRRPMVGGSHGSRGVLSFSLALSEKWPIWAFYSLSWLFSFICVFFFKILFSILFVFIFIFFNMTSLGNKCMSINPLCDQWNFFFPG